MNMRNALRRPWISGLLVFSAITIVLLFVPLSLFDAEITFNNGISRWTVATKMSYAHLFGIGIDASDLQDVESYQFTPGGYLLAVLLNIGFPILIGYRVHIANLVEKGEQQ